MHPPARQRAARYWEAALLVVFVGHTLLIALLATPWHHYDEPTSLEYALLIRDLGRLPAYDEHLPAMRKTIAQSMAATPLFAETISAGRSGDDSIVLGFNQRVHPPAYYALVALTTLPALGLPIEGQLRLGRLTSVALAAICFYMAIHASRLLVADADVRVLVLALLAWLPPFADIMSAVNSDVLANGVAVALLWAAAYAVRPGSWGRLLPLLALALVALGVKRSLVAPTLLLIAWLVVSRSRLGWHVIALGLGALVAVATLTLTALPRRLADWQAVPSDAPVVVRAPTQAYAGSAAFALSRPADAPGPMAVQEVDPALREQAAGHMVTLSALLRADPPGAIVLAPAIQVDQQLHAASVIAGDTWAPVSVSAYVPPGTRYLAVRLSGPFAAGTVFIDQLALVV